MLMSYTHFYTIFPVQKFSVTATVVTDFFKVSWDLFTDLFLIQILLKLQNIEIPDNTIKQSE